MLMSYIGSVGKVMAGSGVEDVLEQCYDPDELEECYDPDPHHTDVIWKSFRKSTAWLFPSSYWA